jgi:hypothetical protein
MRYSVTAKTEGILRQLRRLARQIEPYLSLASLDARNEWDALRHTWPSDDDLRRGRVSMSDAELEGMHAKVCRFGEILRQRGAPAQRSALGYHGQK